MDGDKQQASGNNNSETIEFKIKGAATTRQRQRQPSSSTAKSTTTQQDACTICLDPISERAVAVPCNHLTFDFLCLVSWLQEQSTCPLCKRIVTKVEYDFRSPEDYKTYNVPSEQQSAKVNTSTISQHARRAHLPLNRRRRQPAPSPPSDDPSLSRRRHIYRHRLYALHIGSNRFSQYRSVLTPSDFSSQSLQSKTRTFLRRELQIFSFLDSPSTNIPGRGRGGNRDFLIEYIIAILKTSEIRGADGKAEELVTEFLGRENAKQLLHELEAWLRSPFATLREWDDVVQYADRGGGEK